MLKTEVPWNLKDVLVVHMLRVVLGLLMARALYPLLFTATPTVLEIADRVLIIALVWVVVHRHGGSFASWGLSGQGAFRSVAMGLGAGILLLGFSMFSERLYTTVLMLTPTQHPLVAEVESAATWRDLLVPLLLAGLAAPVAEEVLYRLFTFQALRVRFGLWGGALLSAAIFALMHFNAYWLAEMMVVGLGLAMLYYWTGSLLSAIVAHSFINTTKILLLFLNVPLI